MVKNELKNRMEDCEVAKVRSNWNRGILYNGPRLEGVPAFNLDFCLGSIKVSQ